jgi:hypothetical protein
MPDVDTLVVTALGMAATKLAGVSPRAYLQAIVDMAMKNPRAVLTPASFKASLSPAPT